MSVAVSVLGLVVDAVAGIWIDVGDAPVTLRDDAVVVLLHDRIAGRIHRLEVEDHVRAVLAFQIPDMPQVVLLFVPVIMHVVEFGALHELLAGAQAARGVPLPVVITSPSPTTGPGV